MTKEELKEIAVDFINANKAQTEAERELANAFSMLCSRLYERNQSSQIVLLSGVCLGII